MTRAVVVDGDDTRHTGNGYGNSTAAAEWSFGASSQYFRSRPINRLYWTSYDIIIYYIIMLLCAMDSDSGAARALFIIAVVVVAYTMSVLIELVNWRKLRCTYLYRRTGTVLYYNIRTHKHTHTHTVLSRIAYNNSIIIVIIWRCHLCVRVTDRVLRLTVIPLPVALAQRRRRRGEPETRNGGENNNLVIVVSHLL